MPRTPSYNPFSGNGLNRSPPVAPVACRLLLPRRRSRRPSPSSRRPPRLPCLCRPPAGRAPRGFPALGGGGGCPPPRPPPPPPGRGGAARRPPPPGPPPPPVIPPPATTTTR